MIIVIPALAGIVIGVCNQRDCFRRLFHWLRLTPVHAIPSAWDYKFSKSDGEWILVRLKNGDQVAGWWAGTSFASDDRTERDLFVEQVFEILDAGAWVSTSKSILIMAGEIQTIEFIPQERIEEHDQKAADRADAADDQAVATRTQGSPTSTPG